MANTSCGHYVDHPIGTGPLTLDVRGTEEMTFVVRSMKDLPPFDHIVAQGGSQMSLCLLFLPKEDIEASLTVDIIGENASVNVIGAYICNDKSLKISVSVVHRVSHCQSRQLINGVACGSAKVGVNGKITVAPDAQKAEAYQTNHNILLSPESRVDTVPCLEIYADDVICSHGATVGTLNEDEKFYMQSRGIPENEARKLQITSLLSPILAHIPNEAQLKGAEKALADEIECLPMQ